jgi:hypothetical protein
MYSRLQAIVIQITEGTSVAVLSFDKWSSMPSALCMIFTWVWLLNDFLLCSALASSPASYATVLLAHRPELVPKLIKLQPGVCYGLKYTDDLDH